jgi:hypothetical protein
VAKALEQQVVDIAPCMGSPISVILDSLSLPGGRDEESEDEDNKHDESRTTNMAMVELTTIMASLQVINEEVDWEDIMDNLTWGNDEDHPSDDEEERAM